MNIYLCVSSVCVFRQQELSNLLHEKKYLKALGLAISLDQPHTVLTVIKGNLCWNSFWRMGKMTCIKNSQVWFQCFASWMSLSFIISPVVDLTSRHVSLLHSLWTAALFKTVVTEAFMCAQHCALSLWTTLNVYTKATWVLQRHAPLSCPTMGETSKTKMQWSWKAIMSFSTLGTQSLVEHDEEVSGHTTYCLCYCY